MTHDDQQYAPGQCHFVTLQQLADVLFFLSRQVFFEGSTLCFTLLIDLLSWVCWSSLDRIDGKIEGWLRPMIVTYNLLTVFL